MDKYDLNLKDIDSNFFHFTDEKNIKNINKNGLIPNIGKHAKYLEKSEKVFL